MKIIFAGTVLASANKLEKLIEIGAEVVGVITKRESHFNSDFYDLSIIANKYHIPWIYTQDINSKEVVNFIKEKSPDYIFCFGWSQIIKNKILNLPKQGVVGYHSAELPKNRGRHPIIWALFLGLTETASTFFLMDEGADSGDIISQEKVLISYEDDAGSLYDKITNTALRQIEDFFPKLISGKIKKIKQDHSMANYWRKRTQLDGIIDFRMSSYAVYNLIRALTKPYIGAEFIYKNKNYKVWKAKEEKVNLKNIEPGKVLAIEGKSILVKCYDNAIWLIDHELEDLPKIGDYII